MSRHLLRPILQMHTGNSQFVRPSLGAWTHHGLGSMKENLPGIVKITPATGFGGAQNYGSAFLPAHHQGTRIGSAKRPNAGAEVPNLEPKLSQEKQRAELDPIQTFNRSKLEPETYDPQVK